jgi:hypothetical protein
MKWVEFIIKVVIISLLVALVALVYWIATWPLGAFL